jgi:hypothetical protein
LKEKTKSAKGIKGPASKPLLNADSIIIESLKFEVNELTIKSARLEGNIQSLTNRCSFHERYLKDYHRRLVALQSARGELDTSFLGTSFELQ